MSDELNFTVTETINHQKLLAEAREIIQHADLELGKEAHIKGPSPDKQQALEGLDAFEQAFDRDQAYFGLRLDPQHLTEEDFQQRGVELSRDLKARMEKFDFYHADIPVILFPRAGWAFTRLECEIVFCPEEADPHQCPMIYEMFPENVWTEIFSAQTHLEIGLDGNLTFRAQVKEVEEHSESLSEHARAKLVAKADAGAKFVAGPFTYHIRRAMVRTSDSGD